MFDRNEQLSLEDVDLLDYLPLHSEQFRERDCSKGWIRGALSG